MAAERGRNMKRVRRREYERINEMLDRAVAGEFLESDYNESELSKLEVKWMRCLTSSRLSAKRIEEERERIKELVTDISHQTRTPLANIQLYSQLLQEQELDEKSLGMVEEILIYSKKLEFLIQSLVKTSRLESGVFQLSPSENDLRELAQCVRDAGEERARAKDMRIVVGDRAEGQRADTGGTDKQAAETVTARFDRKWTQEALGNILDNALKYSPDGTEVRILVFSYEMFAGIEIADHGAGIPEEEVPHIFSRFYRGANVHDEQGVGVGLYLARQIIEGQGGYIKVRTRVGAGSRFQVFLPR